MKRTVSIILVLTFLFTLSSCKKAAPESTTSHPTEATAATPPETQAPQTDPPDQAAKLSEQLSVSIQTVSEEYFSEDDALLFKFSYPSMQVEADNPILSQTILSHFEADFSSPEMNDTIDQIKASAADQYSSENDWSPYSFSISYRIPRNDTAISFFGTYDYYSGGAHPNRYQKSANFDTRTGSLLTLDKIVHEPHQIDVLMEFILQELSNTDESVMLFDDYTSVVQSHFTKDSSDYGKWFFTDNGLVFYFCTYEISAYAAGEWYFEIPYTDLKDILLEDYLPQNTSDYQGTLIAAEKENCTFELKEQLGNLYLTDDGPNVVLYADGTLADISVSQGYWNYSGEFQPANTLFSANYLNEGNFISLRSLLETDHSRIQITYQNGVEPQVRYLVIDMDTGSVDLTE